MSFLSIRFLIFLCILFAAYFLCPKRWQWKVLLIANLVFYLSAGVIYAGFLLVTALLAWGFSLRTERINERFKALRSGCITREEKQHNRQMCTRQKKQVMAVVLILNFGIWGFLKYTDILFPLGISFYTFIAMGYCIDVYRGKYAAEKNFFHFLLFLSFFPHIIQGPFSRYDKLRDSLTGEHVFSFERLSEGIVRMLYGFFKKMVVADRLAVVTAAIYSGGEGGIYILLLMAFVTLQLYADFSGYMDIAVGVCRILDIPLQENFRQPFFSRSVEEVWRRWHITLGAWFRDYVFYPVSMSRAAQKLSQKAKEKISVRTARLLPSYLALVCVWTATGLWHGVGLPFLFWGWMNLFFIAAGMQLAPVYQKIRQRLNIREDARGWHLFQMLRTFFLFGYMEMFSDSATVGQALGLTSSLFTKPNWGLIRRPLLLFPGLDGMDIALVLVGILLILTADSLKEKGKDLYRVLESIPIVVRYTGYAALFYAVILLGNTGTDLAGGFLYAQF